ncbi:hypothetical protein EGI22_16180 [Lacihabitans sp. LS3-19]|nr:hypothetical protein [Lacihabitans sp. LS3-19]
MTNITPDLFGRQTLPPKSKKRATESLLGASAVVDTCSQVATISTIIKLKPNSIIQYDRCEWETKRLFNPNRNRNLLGQEGNGVFYNGHLSVNTRRHINEFLSTWLDSIQQNVNLKGSKRQVDNDSVYPTFVTLTLPFTQFHSDNTIKKQILSPFIEWLRSDANAIHVNGNHKGQQKGFGVQAYFWRAESQKNGRIHFHLIVDKYIPWDRIRAKWNQCCERLGYITFYSLSQKEKYKNGFFVDEARLENEISSLVEKTKIILNTSKIPENTNPVFKEYLEIAIKFNKKTLNKAILKKVAKNIQLKAYERAHSIDFRDPNSSDIKPISNLDSIAKYVVKYVCKQTEEAKLAKNQKKIYNEELKRWCVYTYKDEKDPETGEVRQIEVSDEFYEPKFESRKIYGRLWGCSDNFKTRKLAENQEIEKDEIGRSFLIEKNTQDGESTLIKKIPIPTFKHYSKTLCIKELICSIDQEKGKSNYYQSPPQNEDLELQKYVNTMIALCGEDRVNEITKKVGESFERNNGKIIPLEFGKMDINKKHKGKQDRISHLDVLKHYSLALYNDYKAYHQHIFNSLYNLKAS